MDPSSKRCPSRPRRGDRPAGLLKRAALALVVAAAPAVAPVVALSPSVAAAQAQSTPSLEAARSLYAAGVQAYSVGKYATAIKFFEEAERTSPRPSITFSLGQAHRRQYALTKQPENLRAAIRYFREYTSKVEQGDRLPEAAEALSQLEPLAARLDASSPAGSGAPAPTSSSASSRLTQLMVSTAMKEAKVSLDGGAASPVPFIKDVEPGKHKLRVTAEGYVDYVRDIDLKPGPYPMLDIPLAEKPARLTIECQADADVSIDGRLAATTPFLAPLDLPSGRHFIAITKSGHRPITQDVELKRGEVKVVKLNLETTGQRIAAYTMLAGGTAGFILGVFTSVLAAGEQGRAQLILDERSKHAITPARLKEYNDTKDRRNQLAQSAAGLFGTGGVLGAGGLLLYIFDKPPPVALPLRSEEGSKKPSAPGPAPVEPSLDITAGLVWSPGYAGGSITGRF